MALDFARQEKITRYLDPRQDFAEVQIRCEVRRDPLTGRSGRVAHVAGFQLHPVDLRQMIEASRANCPFCPENVLRVTPKFPHDLVPRERVQRGETVLFPNLAPYDEYSAVAALSREHYIPMDGFSPELLGSALSACQDYFRAVQRHPRADYGLVFWNYLPASGGTQIHPHFQLFATDTPGNALEDELAASLRYVAAAGRPYWADLVDAEERLGERAIAHGARSVWLADFVGQSVLADVLVLFPERRTLLDLDAEALDEFCRGLVQTLRRWQSQGIYSFNFAWFPATPDREDFWLHARLSPRVFLTPRLWGPDASALQHLYREHFMVQTPEAAAAALRDALRL
jgi:UDPglucose--hexose-1-phosphate uridylyltransferase